MKLNNLKMICDVRIVATKLDIEYHSAFVCVVKASNIVYWKWRYQDLVLCVNLIKIAVN